MLPPVTLTGRLVRLEPLAPGHEPDLTAAAGEDRSTYGLTSVPEGADGVAAYIERARAQHAAGLEQPFAIVSTATGAAVGSTRFLDLEWWDGPWPTAAEIGHTWLAASAQRTPLNTEAKLLLLTHAFETWGALRVSLKTDARNERSRNAILRIGARFEGIRRAHGPAADGGIRDAAFFSIVRDEWPDVRDALRRRLA